MSIQELQRLEDQFYQDNIEIRYYCNVAILLPNYNIFKLADIQIGESLGSLLEKIPNFQGNKPQHRLKQQRHDRRNYNKIFFIDGKPQPMTAYLFELQPRSMFEIVLLVNYPEPLDNAQYLKRQSEKCDQLLAPLLSVKLENVTPQSIKQEFIQLGFNQQKIQRLERAYSQQPLFEASLTLYQMNQFYGLLNETISKRKFSALSHYLASIILPLPQKQEYAFKDRQFQLYRGVRKERINLNDYRVGQRYYFHSFTSSSLSQSVAKYFAKPKGVIFRIIIGENSPFHNLKVCEIGRFVYDQQEVLLMPNFHFQVMRKYKVKDHHFIEIQEVSHINLLDMNRFTCTKVVWLDKFVNSEQNMKYQQQLRKKFPSLVTFTEFSKAKQNMRRTNRCVLIVSGSLGKDKIRKIEPLQSVSAVIVFCINTAHHREWANNYEVVKDVVIKFEDLEERVKQNFEIFIS